MEFLPLPYYPVEKNTLRFYKYKFLNYEKPIIIEAHNKNEARQKLIYLVEKFNIEHLPIVDESLSLPIYGTTRKIINNVENTWVGNLHQSCWMPTEEFDKFDKIDY